MSLLPPSPISSERNFLCGLAEVRCDVCHLLGLRKVSLILITHPNRTLSGRRHHAHKLLASGYCYENDCILDVLVLRCASPPPPLSFNLGNLRKDHAGLWLFPSLRAFCPAVSSYVFCCLRYTRTSFSAARRREPLYICTPVADGWSCSRAAFASEHIALQCGVDSLA